MNCKATQKYTKTENQPREKQVNNTE